MLFLRMKKKQLDKEKDGVENIKRMLSQMEILQEHMKGKYALYHLEEDSSSAWLQSGENQGWNNRNNEKSFHPHHQQQGNKYPRKYDQDWVEYNVHEEYHTNASESPRSKKSRNIPRVNDLLTRILDKVEGCNDLLQGMRDDFYSLNRKVYFHANVIIMLEEWLSLS